MIKTIFSLEFKKVSKNKNVNNEWLHWEDFDSLRKAQRELQIQKELDRVMAVFDTKQVIRYRITQSSKEVE